MRENGKPLKIIQFRAKNVKRLSAVTIKPEEKSIVLLTGKNRHGKSSTLDAMWMAFGGKAMIPTKPIKSGESEAFVSLDLGEFTVIRRFTENGEYLEVKTHEGFKVTKPQDFLNSKLAGRAENPLNFMRLKPDDQVKALQGMVQIERDIKQIESVVGLKCVDDKGKILKALSDRGSIEILDDAYKHLFEKRKEVNSEVRRLDGVVKSIQVPEGAEEIQPVIVAELFSARKLLDVEKSACDAKRRELQDQAELIKSVRRQVSEKVKGIEELELRLLDLRNEKDLLDHKLRLEEDCYEKEKPLVDAMKDPDFSEIDARIAAADETNKLANHIAERKNALEELSMVKTKSEAMTVRLQNIKEYKTKLIQDAGLPIPGLGFEGGEVSFNGIPLSQASGREQIEISCAICAASNPTIGILTVDIGWSELDSEGKQALMDFASERGLQIWCTQVLEEPGEEGFHIYDGALVAVDGQPFKEEEPEAVQSVQLTGMMLNEVGLEAW